MRQACAGRLPGAGPCTCRVCPPSITPASPASQPQPSASAGLRAAPQGVRRSRCWCSGCLQWVPLSEWMRHTHCPQDGPGVLPRLCCLPSPRGRTTARMPPEILGSEAHALAVCPREVGQGCLGWWHPLTTYLQAAPSLSPTHRAWSRTSGSALGTTGSRESEPHSCSRLLRARGVHPFGASAPCWKKKCCLGPHGKYIVTSHHKKISSCFK